MLVVMGAVEEVQVSIMKIVGVAVVLNLRMTALGTVLVRMSGMNVVSRHVSVSPKRIDLF
jgi:hypothetical protein